MRTIAANKFSIYVPRLYQTFENQVNNIDPIDVLLWVLEQSTLLKLVFLALYNQVKRNRDISIQESFYKCCVCITPPFWSTWCLYIFLLLEQLWHLKIRVIRMTILLSKWNGYRFQITSIEGSCATKNRVNR